MLDIDNILEQLEEATDDFEAGDDAKEFGGTYPPFKFSTAGIVYDKRIINVIAGDKFIGSLEDRNGAWSVSWIKKRDLLTYIEVNGPQQGAELLWQEEIGAITLPIIKRPPTHIPPFEESLTDKATRLVDVLAEGDDLDDDLKDAADFSQPGIIVSLLKDAGFEIIRSDIIDGTMYIEFTWAAGNTIAYVNGWKRAKELIDPYIKLRHGNYVVTRSSKDSDSTAKALIIKPVEDDPSLWKVDVGTTLAAADGFARLYFNNKLVGQAYIASFSPMSDTAERLREEMSELHKISPFDPAAWGPGGNAWGRGPAITWWQQNRNLLPNADKNRHFFDKKLLEP